MAPRPSDFSNGTWEPLCWRFLNEAARQLEVWHHNEEDVQVRTVVTWDVDQWESDSPVEYSLLEAGTLREDDQRELLEDLERYHNCKNTQYWMDGLAWKYRNCRHDQIKADPARWAELPYVGSDEWLGYRNCRTCHSTLAVKRAGQAAVRSVA